ncbi:MAG: PQ-loop repeat-containing protein [Actinobacteria bacterium]|nr:MAG: PQ-loop repeat-containing protein [Actinomycetota bacterium]
MSFRDVFSLWCISLSFTFTIPQAYRVVRRNTVEGVSVFSQMQSLSGSILWVVYGIAAQSYLVVTANVMTIIGFGVVIIAQVRHRAVSWQRVLVVEIAVVSIAIFSGVFSRDVLGVLAVVVGGTGIVPQAIRAARTTHLVGVSVTTFAMVVVMSVSWGIYGLMIDDLYVATPNVVIVPSALFIMLRALQSHHRYGKTTDATAVPAR